MGNKLTTDFLRPFTLSQVTEIHNLALHMQTYGMSAVDVIDVCAEYINDHISNSPQCQLPAESVEPREQAKIACPDCGSPLRMSPVNISKCTNIGGKWRTSLECPACLFTTLSEKTLTEWSAANGV